MSINGFNANNPPANPSITGVPQETKASKAESTAPKPFALKIGQIKGKAPFKESEMNPNVHNGALTQYVSPNNNGVS